MYLYCSYSQSDIMACIVLRFKFTIALGSWTAWTGPLDTENQVVIQLCSYLDIKKLAPEIYLGT